jgi:hypothetical protein
LVSLSFNFNTFTQTIIYNEAFTRQNVKETFGIDDSGAINAQPFINNIADTSLIDKNANGTYGYDGKSLNDFTLFFPKFT